MGNICVALCVRADVTGKRPRTQKGRVLQGHVSVASEKSCRRSDITENCKEGQCRGTLNGLEINMPLVWKRVMLKGVCNSHTLDVRFFLYILPHPATVISEGQEFLPANSTGTNTVESKNEGHWRR